MAPYPPNDLRIILLQGFSKICRPARPKPAALAPAQMTPGQKFLKAKLAELDQIRKTQEFRDYKFAVGGPYDNWPKKVDEEAERQGSLTTWEKVQGLGSLNALAYLYLSTDGFDDVGRQSDLDQIKRSRERIQEVLSTSQ